MATRKPAPVAPVEPEADAPQEMPYETTELGDRTVYVATIGGKKVGMVDLQLTEIDNVFQYIHGTSQLSQAAVFAVCSIRLIDGSPVFPLGSVALYNAVRSKFRAIEIFFLINFYNERFAKDLSVVGDELKNELSGQT